MATGSFIDASVILAPVSAIFVAGYALGFSQNSIPQILDVPPQHSTTIFRRTFYGGSPVILPCILSSSGLSGMLCYLSASSEQKKWYAMAALAAFATVPFTMFWMMPGITRLIQISEDKELQSKVEQTLEVRQLLKAWARQNYVRVGLYVISAYASVKAAIV